MLTGISISLLRRVLPVETSMSNQLLAGAVCGMLE